MAIAIIIILLVIGSLVFHFVSPWWFTDIASNWSAIDDTMSLVLWVCGIVFVLVNFFLAYTIIRFRYNKNRRAHYEPENAKLEGVLTIVTTVGVAGMLIPGLFVWADFIDVPEHANEVEVVGQQWHWSFRLPGEDGQFGKVDTALISEGNPFGLDPDDSNSLDDVLIMSNNLHLLIDQPVNLKLRSKDVLHNFAVPQFRVKMDLVPGISSYLWLTPTKLGRFEILCEELCGMAHYTMRGAVTVQSTQDYQQWLSEQQTFKQTLAQPLGDIVQGKAQYAACASCHGDSGQGNKAFKAPQLAGMSHWYLKRQLGYFKHKIRGSDQDDALGQQMQAMSSMLVSPEATTNVAAYISSLSAVRVAPHDNGDVSKGQSTFTNCAYCHGNSGQGNFTTNAPKLTNQHGWYLKQQLVNFKQGIRGSHLRDLYGNQMQLMAKTLHDEQAIDDVVAYLTSIEATE